MAYTIKDHGKWELYTPKVTPRGYAQGAIYARSLKKKKDWYLYCFDPLAFAPFSVVCTVMPDGDIERIQAVYRDYTAIFPAGMRVIEVLGVDPSIPNGGKDGVHKLFEQKVYNPKTKSIIE